MFRPSPRHWALFGTFVVVASTIGFSAHGLLGAAEPAAASVVGEDARSDVVQDRRSTDPLAPYALDEASPPEITHTPPFPLEEGSIPTKSQALDFPQRYTRFIAKGTDGLDELARDGHLSGAGTTSDPYVLERFYVDGDLIVQSTDRAIIIREGYVNGQLALNYIGPAVYVHHVYAKDLRVNENVARSGSNTGGLFHDNHFGFVGQIRHFIGAFHDNQVGPVPQGIVRDYLADSGTARVADGVVFNFDGFHGAAVYDNVFIGQVDIKLHGHNHADCLTCLIHDHDDENELAADEKVAARHDHGSEDLRDQLGFRTRHSIRYHSLTFHDNEIRVTPGAAYALRYNDRNHAGDDQTANSEPNRFLEDPHVHYQDITLRGNRLVGGPLRLDVFNAADDNHVIQNSGILRLEGNTIELPYERSTSRDRPDLVGFDLRRADGIRLLVVANTVAFSETDDGAPAPALRSVVTYAPRLIGFRLDTFQLGNVTIAENTVHRGDIGVHARLFTEDVHWTLAGNDFRTGTAWSGERVANPPRDEGGRGA